MSNYSRFFMKSYSASKITAISLTEEKAILTIDTHEGTSTDTSLTLEQFYAMKPLVGKYLVVGGDLRSEIIDESQLKWLGEEISLAEVVKLEKKKAA